MFLASRNVFSDIFALEFGKAEQFRITIACCGNEELCNAILGGAKALLRHYQFSELGSFEPVYLAVVFDPDFITALRERFEADYLGQFGVVVFWGLRRYWRFHLRLKPCKVSRMPVSSIIRWA